MKVYLIRGSRISPKSKIYKWHWETSEHGRGVELNSKREVMDNWREFADDNGITDYKFAQRMPNETLR